MKWTRAAVPHFAAPMITRLAPFFGDIFQGCLLSGLEIEVFRMFFVVICADPVVVSVVARVGVAAVVTVFGWLDG